jgi:phage protein U
MQYLRLGELTMAAQDGVTSFEENAGYNYAVISISSGKPSLQAIGETLSEITIGVMLRSALGHDVAGMLAQIDAMRRSGTPQLLVFADGVYKGNYVIVDRPVTIARTDASGTITEADVTINLLEYSDRQVVDQRRTEASSRTVKNTRRVTVR